MVSEAFTSGSFCGMSIEPETSMRNTRLRGGSCSDSMRLPCSPTSSRWCRGAHGHGATSVVTENGCVPAGRGYS